LANRCGLPADLARWREVRDTIYRRIMTRGWSASRGTFVDAAVLMMPLAKFVAPTDPKWLSTLDALGEESVADSSAYRYNPQVSSDGLRGDEGRERSRSARSDIWRR
jgi:GH15 family glucan-1,4-alpha-glucosidase